MDGYPSAFIEHNIPLLVVSGIGGDAKLTKEYPLLEEKGFRITSDAPLIKSEDAQALLKHFTESDARDAVWNAREHSGRNKFRIACAASREYILPPRQAAVPTDYSQFLPSPSKNVSMAAPVLHSPLSPLSPNCPLFPDGLMDWKWTAKHNDILPSVFISCYTLTSDTQFATLHDNQLKSDINKVKEAISRSGHRTRLVVALLSEKSVVKSPDVEERLSNIRRATGLDPKTGMFFLPPQSSAVELKEFVSSILVTLYPVSVEYYRDLSKHSRRKRNRSYIPPPTAPPTSGTSQTLSSQGWNVRYDFKLGVFAEFRQEMEAAIVSYEKSYEALVSEVFETTANWSPRWNDQRLLADVLSIRVVRCLLWNGLTTAASRRWQVHRERIKDLVDRRGKGSLNYGWEAWESRWSCSMAELIQRANLQDLASSTTIYLSPEKIIPIGERLNPWDHLHHPGYWFQEAIKHHYLRRSYALAMPDEDRASPSVTPASKVVIRASTYDTYFCPEPHEENPLPGQKGVDHSSLVVPTFEKAIVEFDARHQIRMVEELKLQTAREHAQCKDWGSAFKVLLPLWESLSYRKDGWWNIVEEVGCLLRSVAAELGNGEAVLAVNWELMDSTAFKKPSSVPQLSSGLADAKAKPSLELKDSNIRSFLTAAYSFELEEGKVGELCYSQLSISSSAWKTSEPLTINEIAIYYEGNLKSTVVRHQVSEQSAKSGRIGKVSLRDSASSESSLVVANNERGILIGESDLTLYPGRTMVIEFSSPLRESGFAKAVSATFSIAAEMFDLKYKLSLHNSAVLESFWYEAAPKMSKKRLVRAEPCTIIILPRPPKVGVRLLAPEQKYYTSEKIVLELEIKNGEEDDAIAKFEVSFGGEHPPSFTLSNVNAEDFVSPSEESIANNETVLGTIISGTSKRVRLTISPATVPTLHDLSAKVKYHLASDEATPLSCTMSSRLDLLSPFEANFEMFPRKHLVPWPSYFNPEDIEAFQPDRAVPTDWKANGISQKWSLTTRYASFASQALTIVDVDIDIIRQNGGLSCQIEKEGSFDFPLEIQPNGLEELRFDVDANKLKLEDRRSASIDLGLKVKWRRPAEGSPVNEITLPSQRFLVCSSEPRVLACASYPVALPSLIHLEFTIENPSMHFLTFGLVMEPSDDFAFSGPKQMSLNLLPLQRRTVGFELIPTVYGKWIQPQFVVRDKYFQKVLRVVPATEGIKIDKKGILVWVPADEDGA